MVLFKSPNLFSGFVDPADNAKAFTADGWLATGDLGWIDAEERLNLSGRSKDLIIRSGHNIDPKIIEDALGAHPAVQLCAAVGAPDAYAGELPVVFATLVPGASASEAELLAFTAARVDEAPAKPKSVVVIEHMPMTNVGKIYKPELRALAARKVAEALVDEACAALGLPARRGRRCRPMARARSRSSIDAAATGAQAAQLQARLAAGARAPAASRRRWCCSKPPPTSNFQPLQETSMTLITSNRRAWLCAAAARPRAGRRHRRPGPDLPRTSRSRWSCPSPPAAAPTCWRA